MIKKTRLPNDKIRVVFSIKLEKSARKVNLVGEFNNWDPKAAPMQYQGTGQDGAWTVALELDAERRYQYRFLVDDSAWVNDPASDGQSPNPHGGVNSVLNLEKSSLPVLIEQPYTDTPYDKLSHPDVGIISPNSSMNEVRQQKTKMIRAQKLDPRTAAELSDRVNGLKRLEVDVFLCCTFDITEDLDQAIHRFGGPHSAEAGKPKYMDGLPYWQELSIPAVTPDELTITHSSVYDDLSMDLQAVEFDL